MRVRDTVRAGKQPVHRITSVGSRLTLLTRTTQALAALQRKAPNASLVAVYKKYCSSKYNEVCNPSQGCRFAKSRHA